MTAAPAVEPRARPLPRRSAVGGTVLSVLLLPLTVWVALAATFATVMAVASGGEYGVTGLALVTVGLLLMATPVLVVVALLVLWIAWRGGRHRRARRALAAALTLQVLGLVAYAVIVTG